MKPFSLQSVKWQLKKLWLMWRQTTGKKTYQVHTAGVSCVQCVSVCPVFIQANPHDVSEGRTSRMLKWIKTEAHCTNLCFQKGKKRWILFHKPGQKGSNLIVILCSPVEPKTKITFQIGVDICTQLVETFINFCRLCQNWREFPEC